MGFCIKISACYEWSCTYFVQGANEENAIKRAYEMFRDSVSYNCPKTLEEAREGESISIKVLAEVEQIII